MKNAYIWWYYYRLVCGNFRCNTNGRKNASTSQKIDNATGSQTDGPDYYTNKISLSDLQKNLKEKKKKQYTFIKHLAFIAKNYLLS